MTAPIRTRFGHEVPAGLLEEHAADARAHLERPLRHARFGATGELWERAAETMGEWSEDRRATMTPQTIRVNERFHMADRLREVATEEPARLRNLIHKGNLPRVRPVIEWMIGRRVNLTGTDPAPHLRATLRRHLMLTDSQIYQ